MKQIGNDNFLKGCTHMANTAIELIGINKQFKGSSTDAVTNAYLKIKEGNFITILGASGSGKTTLLKMINRIYEPSSGEISFFGENIKKMPVEMLRRKIGYVVQQIGLFPHMTVEENIAIVPKILKWDKLRIAERVEYLMDLVKLPSMSYKNRYPSQLSGGQQQRVGIARAMGGDPSVMLMDEPFGAIDAINRHMLQDELKSIQRKLNKTILFVTHDIQEAFKLGDKVVIMNEGKIQQYGTPSDIYLNPANQYVRDLIKSANERIINF